MHGYIACVVGELFPTGAANEAKLLSVGSGLREVETARTGVWWGWAGWVNETEEQA